MREIKSFFPFGKKLDKTISFLYNMNEVEFMKKPINRPNFLEELKKFREIDVIKVVTGVRRSRKIYSF